MADERGSQHQSHGSNRRYGSNNSGKRKGQGQRKGQGGGSFHRGGSQHRNRDFHRDGERGESRQDGERRQRFHRDGESGGSRGYRSGDRRDRNNHGNGQRRDFHRGDRRDFRRDDRRDGERRDFHRDGERRDGDRRDFRRDDRRDDRRNNHHDDRRGDRRDFRRDDRRGDRFNHHDDKRREYMSKSRKNSDGTVSFPSQNPYTDRRPGEPVMPKGLEWNMLSKDERERLRGLSKEHAENIGLHILAAYTLEADDPKAALEHAKWVAKQASRIDFARETLAMVAYRNGDYKFALREFRTAFRMNGYLDYLPFMADCERGLEQPKKAIDIALSDDAKHLTGEPKAEMFLVYAGALADLGMWDQAIEVVSKLVHAKGLAGEYRMRAAQAEQYFLEQSGRSDEAVAMDELIDDLEAKYADVEEDETSDDFVVDYDVEDLPEDLQAKLGVTEDDAQYAPFDDEDGVNMDDETRLPEEEQREGAAMDIEPAEMEERNERRDEEGVMADPDMTDVAEDFNEEDAQIGDDEEQIDSETE